MTETAVSAGRQRRLAWLSIALPWLALACFASACFAPARANMGKPWRDGLLSAEPQGFDKVRIGHESLSIDLSHLSAEAPHARVQVDYRLDNPGPAVRLRPVFATGASGVERFQATIDGRPVAAQSLELAALPDSWQAPANTPALNVPGFNGTGLGELGLSGPSPPSYEVSEPSSMALDFVLPPGRHDFSVSYNADTMHSKGVGPTLLYQFAYVLAPARSWAGFDALDVRVTVPDGWRLATTPALQKDPQDTDPFRDRYDGRYGALPADAIAITTQAPPGIAYRLVTAATLLCLGAVVFGGAAGCILIGGAVARRLLRKHAAAKARRYRVWPYAAAAGLVWGVATIYTGLAAIYAPDEFLPFGQGYRFGYGQGLATIAIVGLSLLLSLVGLIVTRTIALRRLRGAGPDAP